MVEKAQELVDIKTPQEYLLPEQIKQVNFDLQEAKTAAAALKVTSEETMNEANGVCGKIRTRQKGIESFRLAIVKPLKDHIAKIDKFFKDLSGQFEEPLGQIEEKVINYREKRKKAPAKSGYQEGVGRTTFVKTAEHTIENPDLVPDEFWCLDEKKIGARVRELTKDLEVGKTYTDKILGVSIKCTERASYASEK